MFSLIKARFPIKRGLYLRAQLQYLKMIEVGVAKAKAVSDQGRLAKPLQMLVWVTNVSTSPDLYIEFSTEWGSPTSTVSTSTISTSTNFIAIGMKLVLVELLCSKSSTSGNCLCSTH